MLPRFLTSLLLLAGIAVPMNAAAPPEADPERGFTQTVRPFLQTYCTSCHGGAKPAAQFDLQQYVSAQSVVDDFSRWNRVVARLTAREMPPKSANQPPDQVREQVIDWIKTTWATEARTHDGDPGIVLARRLSNAEYNYTIRDLTGVDLRPAREFPIDPANQAGFDNSGESLAMSPALLTKYLQAARSVADHMFLNAGGFAFAPNQMLVETDRDRYCIQQIVDFYDRQNTDYSDYFRAAWIYKHRDVFGKPRAALGDIAAQTRVSAKYLTTIWHALETKEDVGPLATLQTMWRALPIPKADQPDLARDGANRMREFVVRMRKDTALTFASPMVKGLSIRTQPLMNWKNRAYATHRRDFDRAALRVEGEAPPVEPVLPLGRDGKVVGYGLIGLGPNGEDVTALKAQVRAYGSRMENKDLVVPAGQRARYEAAFAKFSAICSFKTSFLGKAAADDKNNPIAMQAIADHFDRVNATLREIEWNVRRTVCLKISASTRG